MVSSLVGVERPFSAQIWLYHRRSNHTLWYDTTW